MKTARSKLFGIIKIYSASSVLEIDFKMNSSMNYAATVSNLVEIISSKKESNVGVPPWLVVSAAGMTAF